MKNNILGESCDFLKLDRLWETLRSKAVVLYKARLCFKSFGNVAITLVSQKSAKPCHLITIYFVEPDLKLEIFPLFNYLLKDFIENKTHHAVR